MLPTNRLILLGMPGSGKTTMGVRISQVSKLSHIDLDSEIESREQDSIPEIFARKGEAYFREAEREALREVLLNPKAFVLSLGGGTPCFFDNMKLIKKSGISVFIDIPLLILKDRLLKTELKHRPKLKDSLKGFEELYRSRLPFFSQADIIMSDKQPSATEILRVSGFKNRE